MDMQEEVAKRILIVVSAFSNGGIESFLLNTLLHINVKNMKIDLAYNGRYSGDIFFPKISTCVNRTFCYGGKLCRSPFFYLPRLFLTMKQFGPYDVVYANAGLFNGFVLLFAYLLNVKKRISHLHSQEYPVRPLKRLRKRICEILILKFTTLHVAPSQAVFESFLPLCLLPNKIIANGIDISNFEFNPSVRSKIRSKLKISPNILLIGHVGRFEKVKNHMFLLEIFSSLHKLHPQSLLLLMGSGDEYIEVQKKINSLRLSKYVLTVHNPEEVGPYYQAMDAFVFPSIKEGLGIVAIEAQCSGLPCFLSDGVPDEAIICNTTKIPLEKSSKEWADIILNKTRDFKRINCVNQIKNAGYDICDTARRIQNEVL